MLGRIGRQFVDDHREGRGRCLPHAHPGHGDANAGRERTLVVVRREQHGQQVAQQRRLPLTSGKRPNQVVSAAQCRQARCQALGHILDRRCRTRRDVGDARGDRQQVLDAMAHLPR